MAVRVEHHDVDWRGQTCYCRAVLNATLVPGEDRLRCSTCGQPIRRTGSAAWHLRWLQLYGLLLGAIDQDADDTASGTTQEITGNNRQRYTIFTSVPSWGHGGEDDPPKMEVLFKATPHGTVIKGLLESDRVPPWMKVQVQENGSSRSGDVVEALEWMLPDAKTAAESIVVMLDWYSGHLTPEVQEVISRKGHVLMFHGGGCTPFTQINDTHLHASLSKSLIQFENDGASTSETRERPARAHL
jgi:hypothetical protein